MSHDISILVMYALTPCHAGSSSALGVVDLPIQREKHTNYPLIYSSGIKGAFRANFERSKFELDGTKKLTESIFGEKGSNGEGNKGGYAGAISVSDAKILAFPMRSSIAPFVWITCLTVLERLNRDLELAGQKKIEYKPLSNNKEAIVLKGDLQGEILIEDYQVSAKEGNEIKNELFAQALRLLLVDDEVFNYGVSHCTQINAQIEIDQGSGSTAKGSLRYQEELPSDTLMYCTVAWGDSRGGNELKADNIKKSIQDVISKYIQVGGDETFGRGIFELTWINKKESEQ